MGFAPDDGDLQLPGLQQKFWREIEIRDFPFGLSRQCSVTDANEVGVGNAAEKTAATRTKANGVTTKPLWRIRQRFFAQETWS
jgi:hypothetical protein